KVYTEGVLTKRAGEDIIAQCEADQQIACEEHQGGEKPGLSCHALVRCTKCREPGHNSCMCKKNTVDTA
ncbi:hypothetical protein BU25DRAFT_354858, partial [Macroventuria anomochaeta]